MMCWIATRVHAYVRTYMCTYTCVHVYVHSGLRVLEYRYVYILQYLLSMDTRVRHVYSGTDTCTLQYGIPVLLEYVHVYRWHATIYILHYHHAITVCCIASKAVLIP